MLPSGRLFLNRDSIYENNRRARQRANWLYDDVNAYVDNAAELGRDPAVRPAKSGTPAFPNLWGKSPEKYDKTLWDRWGVIAEVAEDYPRLLAWLAEGQVSRYWNVFGGWVGFLRLIPACGGSCG